MPMIHLEMIKCGTKEEKEQVAKEFADTLVRVLGKERDSISMNIVEYEPDMWFLHGKSIENIAKEKK